MRTISRLGWSVLLSAGLLAGLAAATAAQDKIKVGWAISKTGPNAGGANVTQIPNYQLWVKEVNDKGGLMRGRQALVEAVKNNICGKTRRDLIPGTLEVHPMDNFGALQMGTARFCDAKRKACDDKSGGVGKFIHLWQNSGDTWKITRVISYDHVLADGKQD